MKLFQGPCGCGAARKPEPSQQPTAGAICARRGFTVHSRAAWLPRPAAVTLGRTRGSRMQAVRTPRAEPCGKPLPRSPYPGLLAAPQDPGREGRRERAPARLIPGCDCAPQGARDPKLCETREGGKHGEKRTNPRSAGRPGAATPRCLRFATQVRPGSARVAPAAAIPRWDRAGVRAGQLRGEPGSLCR